MEWGHKDFLQKIYTKVHMFKVSLMVMDNIIGKMVVFIKEVL